MGGEEQIHDFNPGITPKGLFWTVFAPCESVQFDLKAGTASLHVRHLPMQDYFTLENALVGGGAPPKRAVVSFKVVWQAQGERLRFDNAAQRFRGVFRLASAQMEWSARSGPFDFQSAPLDTSTTDAAELGWERNGTFYGRREEEDDDEN
jgi:hypothetical protein